MLTLSDVMDRGLYYEDVQRLAREHGLPISRRKDELIAELVSTSAVSPAEVVAFVGVDMLRTFLQELGLPSGASRDALAERLVEALERQAIRSSRGAKRPRTKTPANEPPPPLGKAELGSDSAPPSQAIERAEIGPVPSSSSNASVSGGLARPDVMLNVTVPPPPPSEVHVHLPTPERPSAAWGFAAILVAVAVGVVLYAGVALLGIFLGLFVTTVTGVVVSLGLLFTARRWVPWIDELGR